MNENDSIYEIVVFEEIKELLDLNGEPMGYADTSTFDRVGFYYNINSSISAMYENRCDIHEGCFNYGFILTHRPGLYNNYASKDERMFFAWDELRKGFYEAEEPKLFEHLAL